MSKLSLPLCIAPLLFFIGVTSAQKWVSSTGEILMERGCDGEAGTMQMLCGNSFQRKCQSNADCSGGKVCCSKGCIYQCVLQPPHYEPIYAHKLPTPSLADRPVSLAVDECAGIAKYPMRCFATQPGFCKSIVEECVHKPSLPVFEPALHKYPQ